jgi:hypothetical protein
MVEELEWGLGPRVHHRQATSLLALILGVDWRFGWKFPRWALVEHSLPYESNPTASRLYHLHLTPISSNHELQYIEMVSTFHRWRLSKFKTVLEQSKTSGQQNSRRPATDRTTRSRNILGFWEQGLWLDVPGHLWTVMQSVNLDVHNLLEHSQRHLTQCRAGTVDTPHIKWIRSYDLPYIYFKQEKFQIL